MVRFIILRHGYSLYNKEKRYTGQRDIPLDEVGIRQARLASDYLGSRYTVDECWSSDLLRAYETVRPTAERFGLPIHTMPALREIALGAWEGRLIEEVKQTEREAYLDFIAKGPDGRAPGGESRAELAARMVRAMDEIARGKDGKTILVASHGGAIRALLMAWARTPEERVSVSGGVANASITVAEYEDGAARIIAWSLTDHLAQMSAPN